MRLFNTLRKQENWKSLRQKIELKKIKSQERYVKGVTNLLGKPFIYTDSASFAFMYDEIYIKEIYKFQTNSVSPVIIDAGANIGLGITYFKKLYPSSKVIAFEPDHYIFSVLEKNVLQHSPSNVQLINKALWSVEDTLVFSSEGADAGRLYEGNFKRKKIHVNTDLLSKYLDQKIDLLKIDIEGAEVEVLEESKDKLTNVNCIFIEYHSFVKTDQKLSQLLSILEDLGFRYHIQNVSFVSHSPFVQRREDYGMDLQLNIYGYKVK